MLRVRAILILTMLAAAALWLTGCGHYVCDHTFGNATCAASSSGSGSSGSGGSGGSGGGGGGGGAVTPTAYVFSGVVDGGIASYMFSATSQVLEATPNVTNTSTPANSGLGMIVVQGQYLYASFYGTGLYGEIYGWTINSDGSLTAISGSPFAVSNWTGDILGSFTSNPSGTLLFKTDPGAYQGESNVHIYQIGSGGVLTEASGSPVALPFSPEEITMDGLGNYLYIIAVPLNGSTTEVAAYSVSSEGALTAVSGSPFNYPMAGVAGDASGQYLIGTTNSNGGTSPDTHLYVYSIQQSGANAGALTPVTGSPFTTVYSPSTFAVQPKGGELVYSFNNAGSAIEGYQLNTDTGALTAVSGSPFTDFTAALGGFDQSGVYLFALEPDTLSGYQVSSQGSLTSLASLAEGWVGFGIADVPQ